ncbi:cysteine desulfurase family protein [Govanella unica]|uniref:Cysteine desulfurase n=1 Tax=Govanella unica TaxID=2975056 RepID=A0A9X3TXI0_9PROT|nr:aminotransferase class V-fold PLP-dependent enzyme [Govania unica]MDA5193558.1 aminotransferase class V-fold PLP-dependent enzyme [Govania unica]
MTSVYLDYQATTPLDPRVREVMVPYLGDKFGNPHSESHRYGWEAHAALDVARAQVAELIGAEAAEISFTSGATEANNMAIKGTGFAFGHQKRHVVTVATEHKCVLESCLWLKRIGFEVEILPVGPDGLLDLDRVARALRDDTALISVMAVNNEIGVVQPLAEIGALARARGVKFHVDAAQAAGKIPLDVDVIGCDLMSLSAHKMYGPKGVGAIYVRGTPKMVIEPLLHGGGQEAGLRSGTQAPALVAGFGAAAWIARDSMAEETPRIERLGREFLARVRAGLTGVLLNGSEDTRYFGNLNLSFEGVDGDRLIAGLRDLAVSSGAACASGTNESSYVLRAIGVPDALAKSSLRIGFGRMTTQDEMIYAAGRVIAVAQQLQDVA